MGHTHAVFVLMQINFTIIAKVAWLMRAEVRILVINHSCNLDQGILLKQGIIAIYVHVDDFGIMG